MTDQPNTAQVNNEPVRSESVDTPLPSHDMADLHKLMVSNGRTQDSVQQEPQRPAGPTPQQTLANSYFTEDEISKLGAERAAEIAAKHESDSFNQYAQQMEQQYAAQQQQYGPQQPFMQQQPMPGQYQPQGTPLGGQGGPVGWPQPVLPPGPPPFQQQQMPGYPGQMAPYPQQQQQQPNEEFRVKLDPDEVQEDIVKAFDDMQKYYTGQMRQTQQALQQMQEMLYYQTYEQQRAAVDAQIRWFDGKISELGEEFESVYGRGSFGQLTPGSQAAQQRERLIKRYQMFCTYEDRSPDTQDDELFDRFLLVNGIQSGNRSRQLSEQVRHRSGQTLNRPIGRRSSIDKSQRHPETGLPEGDMDDLFERHASYSHRG